MGWGGSTRTRVPDTTAQESELRRQTDALIQQLLAQQTASETLFRDQRAADEARYSEQRAADLAEAERQRNILTQQLTEQRASQEEINTRLAEQQAAAEAQAQERATAARQYSDGRTSIIDQLSGALDGAFGGFNDSYYDQYAKAVVDAGRPTLDRQYREDRRGARLALSDNGNLNSSAAARALGIVKEKYQAGLGAKANEAADAATRLRGQIDEQKRSALSGLINSAFVGDENLPDGVTDVNSALDTITGRLNNYVRSVSEQVRSYVPMAGSGSVNIPTITAPRLGTTALTTGLTNGSGNNATTSRPPPPLEVI